MKTLLFLAFAIAASAADPATTPKPSGLIGSALDKPPYNQQAGVARPVVWLNPRTGKPIKMK